MYIKKGKGSLTLEILNISTRTYSYFQYYKVVCFLFQIDAYCKNKGLVIGGYYQANVNIDNSM